MLAAAAIIIVVIIATVFTSGLPNGSTNVPTSEQTPMDGVQVTATGPPDLRSTGQLVVPINITNDRSTALDLTGMSFTMVLDNGSTITAICSGTDSIAPGQTVALFVTITSSVILNVAAINIVQNNQYVNCTVPGQPIVAPSTPTLDRIKAERQLIVWIDAPLEPFEANDFVSRAHYGFDIDLAHRITENVSDRLGVPITLEVIDAPYNEIPLGLTDNRTDLGMGGITTIPEWSQSVLFSLPYYTAQAEYGLLVKSDDDSLNSPNDLVDATSIVVNTGSVSESWLQANLIDTGLYPTEKVKHLPTIAACVNDVEIGVSQVFIIDRSTAEVYAADSDGNLNVSAVITNYEPYGVAMNKDASDLKAIVDQVIQNMIANGEMAALEAKWGLAS